MAMVLRALGGSMARKLRAVLPDLGLKGEKAVVTEVRYLVSILGGCCLGLCLSVGGIVFATGEFKMLLLSRRCGLRRWRWDEGLWPN